MTATGQVLTARWLIDSDIGGTLVNTKDNSGDTPAHDAADNGYERESGMQLTVPLFATPSY